MLMSCSSLKRTTGLSSPLIFNMHWKGFKLGLLEEWLILLPIVFASGWHSHGKVWASMQSKRCPTLKKNKHTSSSCFPSSIALPSAAVITFPWKSHTISPLENVRVATTPGIKKTMHFQLLRNITCRQTFKGLGLALGTVNCFSYHDLVQHQSPLWPDLLRNTFY